MTDPTMRLMITAWTPGGCVGVAEYDDRKMAEQWLALGYQVRVMRQRDARIGYQEPFDLTATEQHPCAGYAQFHGGTGFAVGGRT